jgi:hypothetical protein
MNVTTKETKVPVTTYKIEKEITLTLNKREAELIGTLFGGTSIPDTVDTINRSRNNYVMGRSIDPTITDEVYSLINDLYRQISNACK